MFLKCNIIVILSFGEKDCLENICINRTVILFCHQPGGGHLCSSAFYSALYSYSVHYALGSSSHAL